MTRAERLQLLDEHGALTATDGDRLIDPEFVRGLYRDLVLARRFDAEAYHLQRQGELALWLSCQGQEAAQVGSIRALRHDDHVFPSYREHAVGLCRGLGPSELLTQWRGTAHGGWDPARYHLHINSLVLGVQLLHATGYAFGVALDRRRGSGHDEVVLCYVGDGATSEGDASEAFNWAAVRGVPIIFFCQNNQWALSTPTSAQSSTPLHERAAAFGLRSTLVDGNDVLACFEATRAAAERVRRGGGAEFIEATTYRMKGHSTSDDPTRYRDGAELDEWAKRDPLIRVRALLDDRGWADSEYYRMLDEEAESLAEATRQSCHALQPPRLEDVFEATYAHEDRQLAEQRQQYTDWKDSFV